VSALIATVGRSPRPALLKGTRAAALALVGLLSAIAIASLCVAQPAAAVITSVGGAQFGVQPETPPPAEFAKITKPLSYGKGPVVHSSASYALYWDHRAGEYTGEWERLISGFLFGAGGDSGGLGNNFAVITQYHDTTGAKAAYDQTFRGDYTDTDPYPSSGNCSEGAICLTDAQIRAELTKYITDLALPTGLNPSSGPTPIYFVFTPPKVTVCLEGSGESGHCSSPASAHPLCSYHSFVPAGGALPSPVLYVVEPWTAGNYGKFELPQVSGSGCQDGTGVIQEPNQIGLGAEGEYGAGLADLIVNNVADEALSTATNPLFTAWHDSGPEADEVVDKCRNDFLGGELLGPPEASVDEHTLAGKSHNQTINGVRYYLNDVFNQAAWYAPYPGVPCINGVSIVPAFTTHNPIRSGDEATFSTTQSDITLGVQKYSWSFGDGTGTEANCEDRVPTNGYGPQECTGTSGTNITNPVASTEHIYTYGGTYEVTLTITDYAGNTASVTHDVTITGPPAPTPAHKEEAAGGSSSTTQSSDSPSATPSIAGPAQDNPPAPAAKVVATQSVAAQSLPSALKNGLVIRYSVNEQVAGRFEVLLATSIARKLGLRGSPATGLAKGTPPQTVIAKAILVTTKGGQSSYKLKLSKATAKRLRKLKKVSLMIRMVVHNASSPAATSVLETVNLSR
jgi:PKD domain